MTRWLLPLLLLVLMPHLAWAQGAQPVAVCVPNGTTCPNVTNSNGFPVQIVSGGGTGGTASSFGATFPATGTAIGVKNGLNMVNLAADASSNLLVNCASGCAGGTFNNNADAIATSATNGQTAAFLYGFNGTTFDRLRVDGSKNLFVNLNTAIPAGANTIGAVTQASGPWSVNLTQVAGSAIATGAGTATGAVRVEIANNGAGLVGLNAGTNTIGKVDLLGNAGATLDFAGQNATAPANSVMTGCIFNQTQPGITAGNVTPLNCDNVGNLRTTVVSGLPAGANTIGAVTQAGAWTVGLSAGSANVGSIDILSSTGAALDFAGQNAAAPRSLEVGCQFNTLPTTVTSGNATPLQCDNKGNTLVNLSTAIPTGANVIGAVTQSGGPWSANITQVAGAAISQGHGTAATAVRVELPTDGTGTVGLNAGSNVIGTVGNVPVTSGGLNITSAVVPANTTAVVVKASAGQLYGVDGFSISTATPVYVKVYNATSATCGAGTPVARYMIPASGGVSGSGLVRSDSNGVAFSTGITYCITAGIADNDTTAPAASTYVAQVYYK